MYTCAHSSLKIVVTVRTLRLCSIGINRFRLIGLVELFRVLLAKKPFSVVLVVLVNVVMLA